MDSRTLHRRGATHNLSPADLPFMAFHRRRSADASLQLVEGLGTETLPARESEQMMDEPGAMTDCALDVLEELDLLGLSFSAQNPLEVAADHGEHVAEVVRDAARQSADALHLLCFEHPRFRFLAQRRLAQQKCGEGR
jgi:hypothetical protein